MSDAMPTDLQGNTDNIEIVPGADLGNMFLVRVNGEVKRKANTQKNILLYKHGLYSLLQEDGGRTVLCDDPYIAVEPTNNDNVYTIWNGKERHPVMNPPSKSGDVLQGVIDAIEHNDYSAIQDVYKYVLDNQVRRQVINQLIDLFPPNVVKHNEGWNINGMFLITWDTNVYLTSNDLETGSYEVRSGIQQTDETREFLTLTPPEQPDRKEVTIHGEEYLLGELEMMFLAKVKYLLNFRENLDDEAFYSVLERHITDTFKENSE